MSVGTLMVTDMLTSTGGMLDVVNEGYLFVSFYDT